MLTKMGHFDKPSNTVRNLVIAVSVTIFVTAFLYTWSLSFIRHDKATPKVTMECYESQHGDYVVEISKHDYATQVDFYNFHLRDNRGREIESGAGSVMNIYCLDLEFPDNQKFTFMDRNIDGRFNSGDYFILRSVENGGIVHAGWEMSITFDISGKEVGSVKLRSMPLKEFPYNHSTLSLIYMDSSNISFDQSSGFFSHWACFSGRNLAYNVLLTYNGSEPRTIAFSLFDGEYMVDDMVISVNQSDSISFTESFTPVMTDSTSTSTVSNLTLRAFDMDSNQTLFEGYYQYQVVQFWNPNPSFLHSSSLQLVTIIVIGLIALPHLRKRT